MSTTPAGALPLRAHAPLTRADFHAAQGVLLVVRNPPPAPPPVKGQPALVAGNPAEGVEILIAVWDDGSVTALNGHVDLGTGIRTALAQIVAEELDVPLARVHMVLGDTARAPNQGATIASASIQIHARPLRIAAAQARHWLVARAAARLGVAADTLRVQAGVVQAAAEPARQMAYGELLAGAHTTLELAEATPTKPAADYTVVGQPVPRVDIPAKVSGELVFVHDMRVPGMLHGRVVRPPYAGADHGDFIGNTLESVDQSSIAHIPGIRAVVVIRDFVGIVAEREEQAEQALRELKVQWKHWPGFPRQDSAEAVEQAIRANPATQRRLVDEGDVDAALAAADQPMPRTYVWPYQLHGSIGPSCAVAEWRQDETSGRARMAVWAGTQNPHVLRADLARLMGLADVDIDLVRMEAAGCYGRNGADDVAADAALLSRAVGAPVRVQLTREQEHLWEPKGTAQLMQVRGGLNADGSVAAYDFETSYPSNGAPTLALLLTRTIEPVAQAYEMGDRTARPPYGYDNLRVAVNDMAPIVRASWLRGVSALPNSFAHESYVDELATAAGVDPVEFRLQLLNDPRAAELVQATAEKAGWVRRTGPLQRGLDGDWVQGQGFAYARYIHSKWPGFGAAWAAWVADVDVNRKTGEVHVRRVVVGHDAGLMVNPAGVEHQVHGNVVQTTSRALKEQVRFDPVTQAVDTREWGSYPILSFREVPVIEVMHMPRQDEAPLGAGESSSVPGTAAIANAIFDATGVRFRAPPFTPEVVRAGLNPLPGNAGAGDAGTAGTATTQPADVLPTLELPAPTVPATATWPRQRSPWARALALAAGGLAMGAALLGWRPSIAPVVQTAGGAAVYNAATIERGRLLAAAGDCVVCHTAPGGTPNTGGRGMETPFGTVYTTNLTPDAETGIGRWSFSAFQRAMREGISRDGRHLYPAFPYTSFAKMSDDDLTAVYAYLMAQPAVRAEVPATRLAFPFSVRPLMAGWNALFHDATPWKPDPARPPEWNRGAYLVQGVGHCGACHTPRNALGAEQGGAAFLSGALIDGWEAPALTGLSKAPVPWSAESLYGYLRHGHSAQHGSASGPMAPVVRELAHLPDGDIRAMATYLASFTAATEPAADAARARATAAVAQAAALAPQPGSAQRLFDGACAACHHDGDGPKLLGVNVPLALNSNLHSDRPDNLLQVIVHGIREPATRDIGFMPGFGHALSDAQITELAGYMRQRYAPGRPAWRDVPEALARVRAGPAHP
ncbi:MULTISPECIES: molybdopterin cofactor-binding domain-containing protein [unclassified Acidovorax]|uniref:molybdopterin cofactor-binding domain-containing protein n=1 Tax=unclassified Acidovorax TaxID=2684926 RepID=UPI001C47C4BC|nr:MULTISPECIES: molybdopterin cofactor-binding domain-containing protein [unclassified Acidovorax]MBV7429548.1 molybdopterin-dependent oxidoreductase [Acidovorax sp. sif0732]MBV7448626.1 molybdopterin-dependent oxidoreductase [Acidovorax sp. sif0715]